MIPVETVVRKLIADCDFVILPGFGALISRHIAAGYDTETSIFSPPEKRLAFNESLKLDDGVVANWISRHEHVSHSEAVMHIKRYTDRLWIILEAAGEAKIEGIGLFRTNVEGKLVFEPDTEKRFSNEWYGFGQVNARLFECHLGSDQVLVKQDLEEEAEIIEVEAPGSRFNWARWMSAAVLLGAVSYFSFMFVSGNFEYKSTLNPFSGMFGKEPFVVNSLQEETLLEQVEADPVVAVDSLVNITEESVPVDSVKVEAVIDSVETIPTGLPGKFYVIAGAFKGNKQANVLLQQLKDKGFDHAVLVPADSRSNRVKVAVNAFALESEAYSASKELKDVIGEIGWVYEVK